MTLRSHAAAVAGAGRGPDTTLVHMSSAEVADLNRLSLSAGLGSLPRNPETGMPEAGLLGDLLKKAGSVGVGVLGTALGGPLGGALASGLFSGIMEKDLKKGLFAGLGSFMLGSGLDAAIRSGAAKSAAGAGTDAAIDAAGMGLAEAATQAPIQRGLGSYLDALKGAGWGGANAGFKSVMDGPLPFTALPMMRSLEMAWRNDGGSGLDEIREEHRDKFRGRFGKNPYANLYAMRYAGGGRISSRAAGGVGPGMDHNRFAYGGEVGHPDGIRRFEHGGPTHVYNPMSYDNLHPDSEYDWNGPYQPHESWAKKKNDVPTSHLFPTAVPGPNEGFTPGFMPEHTYFDAREYSPNAPEGERYGPREQFGTGSAPRGRIGTSGGFTPVGINPFDMGLGAMFAGDEGRNFLSELGGRGSPRTFGPEGGPGVTPYVQSRAGGGLMYASGGPPLGPPRYVDGGQIGPSGGMSDSVPGRIDSTGEPILVSPGEYIVPADVVSMMGDGNTEAGSAVLENMISKIRIQKTGSPEQLPQMDPNLLPV